PRATPERVAAVGALPEMSVANGPGWEAYATVSGQTWNYDPLTQGSSPAFSAGVSRNLPGNWRIGLGVSADRGNEDTIFNGRYETSGWGGHAFVSWNAGNHGWRFFALTNYLNLDATIHRGYVNGSGTATSRGSTTGYTYGLLARGEYAFPVGERFDLVP